MQKGLEKFNQLVEAFEALPTVGKKSALRFAYHIVMNDSFGGLKLANAIESALRNITKCSICGSISENEICDICTDEFRQKEILCLVESPKDIFIMEENKIYNGMYFVLSNLEEESINSLRKNIIKNNVQELIFAFTPSLSSDGIILFIEDKLKDLNLSFTKIAQGVPTGVSIENIDALSLAKAMEARVKI